MYKIRVSIIYTSMGEIVWENDLSFRILEFSNIFRRNTFSLRKQKYHVYGISVGIYSLCSESGRDQIGQDL